MGFCFYYNLLIDAAQQPFPNSLLDNTGNVRGNII